MCRSQAILLLLKITPGKLKKVRKRRFGATKNTCVISECRFTLKKLENLSLGNCRDIDVFLNQVEFHYFVKIFSA